MPSNLNAFRQTINVKITTTTPLCGGRPYNRELIETRQAKRAAGKSPEIGVPAAVFKAPTEAALKKIKAAAEAAGALPSEVLAADVADGTVIPTSVKNLDEVVQENLEHLPEGEFEKVTQGFDVVKIDGREVLAIPARNIRSMFKQAFDEIGAAGRQCSSKEDRKKWFAYKDNFTKRFHAFGTLENGMYVPIYRGGDMLTDVDGFRQAVVHPVPSPGRPTPVACLKNVGFVDSGVTIRFVARLIAESDDVVPLMTLWLDHAAMMGFGTRLLAAASAWIKILPMLCPLQERDGKPDLLRPTLTARGRSVGQSSSFHAGGQSAPHRRPFRPSPIPAPQQRPDLTKPRRRPFRPSPNRSQRPILSIPQQRPVHSIPCPPIGEK